MYHCQLWRTIEQEVDAIIIILTIRSQTVPEAEWKMIRMAATEGKISTSQKYGKCGEYFLGMLDLLQNMGNGHEENISTTTL